MFDFGKDVFDFLKDIYNVNIFIGNVATNHKEVKP